MQDKEQEVLNDSMEDANSEHDSAKSHEEILGDQISDGEETFEKTSLSLWLSSFAAGLEIGFSLLLIGVLHSFLVGKVSEATIFKLMAIKIHIPSSSLVLIYLSI